VFIMPSRHAAYLHDNLPLTRRVDRSAQTLRRFGNWATPAFFPCDQSTGPTQYRSDRSRCDAACPRPIIDNTIPVPESASTPSTVAAAGTQAPTEQLVPGSIQGDTAVVDAQSPLEEPLTDEDDDSAEATPGRPRVRRRQIVRSDAEELRLRGRRALCKTIPDLAGDMLKTVKLRVLGRYLESTRNLEEDDLTNIIKKEAGKLSDRARVIEAFNAPDPDFNRGQLKAIIFSILLQEETHGIEESRLEEKVIEFEKDLVKRSKTLDFFDQKKHDPDRWHYYDTYRIVLEAAWGNDDLISPDEARLLGVLRDHLNISLEEHWLISAMLKRFPKQKCGLHTPDEVNDARKELQREGLLWSYRDESNRNIDVIPAEIAAVIRKDLVRQELQRTNYRRLLHHDGITLAELRTVLQKRNMDRYGNKEELIERIVASDIRPSEVLGDLDRQKLIEMCGYVGLRVSGTKPELIERLIDFYDDLTFEERITRDKREV
jgi:hypothetical protein